MTSQPQLGFSIKLKDPFDQAIELVTRELKKEGFGILTRIDAHKTLKEKLDVDFHPYVILGACNPPLAHKALSADSAAGLLLPCNVVVEASPDGGSVIIIANPQMMLSLGSLTTPALVDVANQATERLLRVVQAIQSQHL